MQYIYERGGFDTHLSVSSCEMSSQEVVNAVGLESKVSALDCVAQNDICSLRIICNLAINQNLDLEEVDYYGNTALLKACYLGRYEAVETLLQFGANIKATNYFGQNALTLATHAGSLQLVRKLLRHRSYASFNAASIVPALCVATFRQNKPLISYFRSLEKKKNSESTELIETVHGLTPDDLEMMINVTANSTKNPKHLYM